MRRSIAIPLAATSVIGVAVGLGAYTFIYAKGYSYLTNDPAACANCHVMQAQYDGWMKSSHHSVATGNDCSVGHSESAAAGLISIPIRSPDEHSSK